jgi:hypothetical protein
MFADCRSQLAAREAELEEVYQRCAVLELQLQSSDGRMRELAKLDATPIAPTRGRFVPTGMKCPSHTNGVPSEEEQHASYEQALIEAQWDEICLQEKLENEACRHEMDSHNSWESLDD